MEDIKNIRKELVDKIIEAMKGRDGVWQKTWSNFSHAEAPYNPITGIKYKGINFINLSLEQTKLETLDPRWCTFNQAVTAGYKITKGSKAAQACFFDINFDLINGKQKHHLFGKTNADYNLAIINYYRTTCPDKHSAIHDVVSKIPDNEKSGIDRLSISRMVDNLNKATNINIKLAATPIMRTFPLFNYSQLVNAPKLEIQIGSKDECIERAEGILIASGAKIYHDNKNENYYITSKHEIHLTPKKAFNNLDAYYSTALHELAHWTKGDGIPRNLTIEGELNTDSLAYAREELRAELASVFMSSDLDLKLDIPNHAAYLGSYIKVLTNDYTEFYAAVNDAQKISNHILGFEKRLDLTTEEAKYIGQSNPELYKNIKEFVNSKNISNETEFSENYDLKVGDVYAAMHKDILRKYEILEIRPDKIFSKDLINDLPMEHTVTSFKNMLKEDHFRKLDTKSPQIKIDSLFSFIGQGLMKKEYHNTVIQNIERSFIFKDNDNANQFIDKIITKYKVPKNAILMSNIDRNVEIENTYFKNGKDKHLSNLGIKQLNTYNNSTSIYTHDSNEIISAPTRSGRALNIIEAKKPANEINKFEDFSLGHNKGVSNKEFIRNFFIEKDLPLKTFAISHSNEPYFIDSNEVIDYVINKLDDKGQERVKGILAKLNFANNDTVHDYLRHCALGMVAQIEDNKEKLNTLNNSILQNDPGEELEK